MKDNGKISYITIDDSIEDQICFDISSSSSISIKSNKNLDQNIETCHNGYQNIQYIKITHDDDSDLSLPDLENNTLPLSSIQHECKNNKNLNNCNPKFLGDDLNSLSTLLSNNDNLKESSIIKNTKVLSYKNPSPKTEINSLDLSIIKGDGKKSPKTLRHGPVEFHNFPNSCSTPISKTQHKSIPILTKINGITNYNDISLLKECSVVLEDYTIFKPDVSHGNNMPKLTDPVDRPDKFIGPNKGSSPAQKTCVFVEDSEITILEESNLNNLEKDILYVKHINKSQKRDKSFALHKRNSPKIYSNDLLQPPLDNIIDLPELEQPSSKNNNVEMEEILDLSLKPTTSQITTSLICDNHLDYDPYELPDIDINNNNIEDVKDNIKFSHNSSQPQSNSAGYLSTKISHNIKDKTTISLDKQTTSCSKNYCPDFHETPLSRYNKKTICDSNVDLLDNSNTLSHDSQTLRFNLDTNLPHLVSTTSTKSAVNKRGHKTARSSKTPREKCHLEGMEQRIDLTYATQYYNLAVNSSPHPKCTKLAVPELIKEAAKYGVKKLPKTKLVKILNAIYNFQDKPVPYAPSNSNININVTTSPQVVNNSQKTPNSAKVSSSGILEPKRQRKQKTQNLLDKPSKRLKKSSHDNLDDHIQTSTTANKNVLETFPKKVSENYETSKFIFLDQNYIECPKAFTKNDACETASVCLSSDQSDIFRGENISPFLNDPELLKNLTMGQDLEASNNLSIASTLSDKTRDLDMAEPLNLKRYPDLNESMPLGLLQRIGIVLSPSKTSQDRTFSPENAGPCSSSSDQDVKAADSIKTTYSYVPPLGSPNENFPFPEPSRPKPGITRKLEVSDLILQNFVRANADLYRDVLLYKPLDLNLVFERLNNVYLPSLTFCYTQTPDQMETIETPQINSQNKQNENLNTNAPTLDSSVDTHINAAIDSVINNFGHIDSSDKNNNNNYSTKGSSPKSSLNVEYVYKKCNKRRLIQFLDAKCITFRFPHIKDWNHKPKRKRPRRP